VASQLMRAFAAFEVNVTMVGWRRRFEVIEVTHEAGRRAVGVHDESHGLLGRRGSARAGRASVRHVCQPPVSEWSLAGLVRAVELNGEKCRPRPLRRHAFRGRTTQGSTTFTV